MAVTDISLELEGEARLGYVDLWVIRLETVFKTKELGELTQEWMCSETEIPEIRLKETNAYSGSSQIFSFRSSLRT